MIRDTWKPSNPNWHFYPSLGRRSNMGVKITETPKSGTENACTTESNFCKRQPKMHFWNHPFCETVLLRTSRIWHEDCSSNFDSECLPRSARQILPSKEKLFGCENTPLTATYIKSVVHFWHTLRVFALTNPYVAIDDKLKRQTTTNN